MHKLPRFLKASFGNPDSMIECYRQFAVLLESEKGGEVELEVIYQVNGASWSPRYDIRVQTGEKKSLKVNVFDFFELLFR